MSNQYFNIAYDPAKQGYSTSTWRTIYGDVAVVNGQLQFTKAAILHYGDILRGDAVFSLNIAAPVIGDNSKFGFTQYSKGAYLYFQISNGVLTAECSNGTVSTSSAVIPWVADWTDTDTEFRIKWEAGTATFSIGGQYKVVFNDTYALEVPTTLIPGCPMSLYVASDAPDQLLLDYILVKNIQSYVLSTGNANSSFEVFVTESDKLSVSDIITNLVITPLHTNSGIIAETPKIREDVTMLMKILIANESVITETPKIRESVTVSEPV